MARKLTNAEITETFVKITEAYFRAANMRGIYGNVRDHLESQWSTMQKISYILATKNAGELDMLLNVALGWEKTARECQEEHDKKTCSH